MVLIHWGFVYIKFLAIVNIAKNKYTKRQGLWF